MLRWTQTRNARFGAACALILACFSLPASARRQSSGSSDGAAKKPAAHKPATKTTSPTHHATSSKASTATKAAGTTHATTAGKHSSRRKKSAHARGQQKIDSERAQQIQEALIREHYLSGEATGKWTPACEDAMRRYQADHGWQSKTVPDSRALISLGLGPSKDHLLNPESAMTSGPAPPRTPTVTPVAQPTPAATNPVQSDPPSPQ
ncbi:MAG TPA: peptidoglycan-binding domain-containing protein [Candidatus Acidoferrales bacterium]|nr:peptidoglycan-binding domain-containing protein [Candidatus Acidoferrales bacterium]